MAAVTQVKAEYITMLYIKIFFFLNQTTVG